MARRFRHVLVLTTLVFSIVSLVTQPASSQQPLPPAARAIHINLGQAAVPLYGPWKFTIGDSPTDALTGRPLWAEPSFDDSHWETVDLTPAEGSFEPIQGTPGFVPGWTAKGHPGYWGYGWYRIRVEADTQNLSGSPEQASKLALAGPKSYDTVYQIFSNGSLLGGFGDFSGKTPVDYYNVPKLFQLTKPDAVAAGSRRGVVTEVLAFRVWMGPETLLAEPEAGGLHGPPVLGEAKVVEAGYQLRWLDLVRALSPVLILGIFHLILAVLAVSLLLFDRTDRVYMWIGAVFLLQAIYAWFEVFDSCTQHLSITADGLLGDGITFSLIMAGWVMVWWNWFGLRSRWIPRTAAVLVLVWIVSRTIGQELFFGLVPHGIAVQFWVIQLLVRGMFFFLMLWIVFQGIRRYGVEGWLVLLPVLLRAIGAFSGELRLLGLRVSLHPFGANVTLSELATMLMALAVALLLLRRLLRSVKAQRLMALDVKQAQEVQQVILPQALTVLPGLVVESDYRPAREVGGDFFQILPNASDGSLLIVAGDVTGKGLKAGMVVALLVGAVRTAVQYDPAPLAVLNTLNQRLLGRNDSQATCLALRIDPDGSATLANAGHMAPYLNGESMEMEGALPLGMIDGAQFSVMRFKLNEGDRLMLMSDGIPEARDANGNLFGFERVHQLLRTAKSIAEISNVVESFGQEDDISVISVTLTAKIEVCAGMSE